MSIICVVSFVIFQNQHKGIKTDSHTTVFENIKMGHNVRDAGWGKIGVRVRLWDLDYDGKNDSVLIEDGIEKIEITSGTDKEIILEEVPIFEFPEFTIGIQEPEKKTIKKFYAVLYSFLEQKRIKEDVFYQQPYIGEDKIFLITEEKSGEKYEGPIEIRMNSAKFSKVFIGKVEDGWFEVEEEKVIVHN